MKTLNLKQNLYLGLSILFLVTLSACNKDSGSSAQAAAQAPYVPAGVGPAVSCSNCFPNPTPLIQTLQSTTGMQDANMILTLLVPANGTIPSGVAYYQGPVELQGTLTIAGNAQGQGLLPSFCSAVPGQYTISTESVGTMQNGTIYNMVLQASGPSGLITMQISQALVNTYTGRVGFYINSMQLSNGQTCPQLVTY